MKCSGAPSACGVQCSSERPFFNEFLCPCIISGVFFLIPHYLSYQGNSFESYVIYFSLFLNLAHKVCSCGVIVHDIPYFLDWNARVLLVSSELLAGVVFEGAFYSRARSIPFSLSVTKFFSKHKKPWTISLHNHTILIHHKQNYFIQHTNVRFIY